MKTTNMKWTTVLLFGLVQMTSALAEGGKVGNGGDVILRDGKAYLLDLVEAGAEKKKAPSCQPGNGKTAYRSYVTIHGLDQGELGQEAYEILGGLLNCLHDVDVMAIHAAAESYRFRLINDEVGDLHDEDTVLKQKPVQVAYRRDHLVYVYSKLWDLMDPTNRAALVLHELFYSLLVPTKLIDGSYAQESRYVHAIVGDLFVEGFAFPWRIDTRYTREGKSILTHRRVLESKFGNRLGGLDYAAGTYHFSRGKLKYNFAPRIELKLTRTMRNFDYLYDALSIFEYPKTPDRELVTETCQLLRDEKTGADFRALYTTVGFEFVDFATKEGYTKLFQMTEVKDEISEYLEYPMPPNGELKRWNLKFSITNGTSYNACRQKLASALNTAAEGITYKGSFRSEKNL